MSSHSICPRCGSTDTDVLGCNAQFAGQPCGHRACTCGDWQDDHVNGTGRCLICASSSAPWDRQGCKKFTPWSADG